MNQTSMATKKLMMINLSLEPYFGNPGARGFRPMKAGRRPLFRQYLAATPVLPDGPAI